MSQTQEHNKITHVLLKDLITSPTQPRKAFDLGLLQELASSFNTHGILQPLLVRWLGHGYEVVDGERRWRAAELADLKSVPCLVKELTDEQVVQIQVIQAIHRAELTPLEEAQAYKRLLDGGMPLDDLVANVGKGKAYIYHRSRLLDLAPEVQDHLAVGELKLSYAEAFARVPDHQTQLQLLPLALKMGSLESLQQLIEERFLLQLARAPFNTKDADLHPAAGACSACPKRTGAQEDLFGAAGKTDTCLDSACWNAKAGAHQTLVTARAEKKGGELVLTGKQAAKVLKAIQQSEWRPGKYAEAKLKPTWLKEGTLGEALKGTDVKPLQVFDPSSGKIRQVYDLAAAQAAIPAKLKRAEDGGHHVKALSPEQQAKEAHKRRVEHLVGQLLDRDAMKAVWEALRKKNASVPALQAANKLQLGRWHREEVLAEVLGQKKLDLKKAASSPQAGVALLVVTAMHLSDDGPETGATPDLLKAVGVDVKALKKKALAEAEALVIEEEQSAAKAAAAGKAKNQGGLAAEAPDDDEAEDQDDQDEDEDGEDVPKKKRK